MSAQAADRFLYNQETYTAIRESVPVSFKPQDYGLEPHMRHTGCLRGYCCDYEITDDGFFLENLYIFNKDGNYPDLYGISISPVEYEEVYSQTLFGAGSDKLTLRKIEKYTGHRRYANVHMPIPYSGRILAGNRFISDFHIRIGTQRTFAYRVVKEFVIEDSRLTEIIDQSEIAKEMRKFINRKDPDWRFKPWEQIFAEHMGPKNKNWWME